MLTIALTFIAGLLVADIAWAWKTRTIHRVWRRLFPAPVTYVTYTGCEYCPHCNPEHDEEHDEDTDSEHQS
jgi:hypothetical protein